MGKLCRIKCKTREEWLSKRKDGIGSSDSSAVVGLSPWLTANELWKLKIGNAEHKDLSDDSFVQKGVRLEPALREVYKAMHPEITVRHEPIDMWYQKDRPWLFATLDGRIIDKENRKNGCLEIKTSTPNNKAGWEKWNGKIPEHYYVQCLHELLASGYDYAVLFACLFNAEGDFVCREYRYEREEVQEDLKWLLEKEEDFWQSVQNKTLPPMTLVL